MQLIRRINFERFYQRVERKELKLKYSTYKASAYYLNLADNKLNSYTTIAHLEIGNQINSQKESLRVAYCRLTGKYMW